MIKQNKMLEVPVSYPFFFWAYQYMYWHQDFNKSIGECTVRQADQQNLWLFLTAF